MKILSLFNGCSGTYIGAIQAGFEVTQYHYSEIDKPANKVTQHNIPFAVNLGDVRNVKGGDYDLIVFGSPCQGFSIAGKRLNFADERSMLFFEALRILRECQEVNPNIYWIMENVASMAADIKTAISRELGINPLEINSALVSAQNRQRYYWTNIGKVQQGLFGDFVCGIPQPLDRGIYLRDILQPSHEVPEKYDMSVKSLERIFKVGLPKKYSEINGGKAITMIARQYGHGNGNYVGEATGFVVDHHEMGFSDKSNCIDANYLKGLDNHGQRTGVVQVGGNHSDMDIILQNRIECINQNEAGYKTDRIYSETGKLTTLLSGNSGRNNVVHAAAIIGRKINDQGKRADNDKEIQTLQRIEINENPEKTHCLTSVEKDNVVIEQQQKIDFKYLYKNHPAVLLEMVKNKQVRIRRLTPIEVTRLQTMPDGWFFDKDGQQLVSSSQIYKMTGNGFTTEVIAHILRHIPKQ